LSSCVTISVWRTLLHGVSYSIVSVFHHLWLTMLTTDWPSVTTTWNGATAMFQQERWVVWMDSRTTRAFQLQSGQLSSQIHRDKWQGPMNYFTWGTDRLRGNTFTWAQHPLQKRNV